MESPKANRKKSRLHQCKACDKVYATGHGLRRHEQVAHDAEDVPGRYKCDQCFHAVFKQREKLLKHLILDHGFEHDYEERRFRSLQDFMRWKEREEQREKVCFIATSGTKAYYNGRRGRYFVCHRSGQYIPKGKGKRRLKSQGSCKINAHCMATMNAIEDLETGVVKVVYQKRHYGHDIDLGHLRLSRVEKQAIATQLAQGTPPGAVLENVKKSRGRELRKIHLVTMRDLYNIAKRDLGTTLVKLREEGPSAANLKFMKQEPSSGLLNSSSSVGLDTHQPTECISANDEGFINGLPGATFQDVSQLTIVPIAANQQVGANAANLKVMKQDPSSQPSNRFGNNGQFMVLPSPTFQGSSQLVPIVINQQGGVPLVFSSVVPAGAQNGSVIVFGSPATTVQNRGNPTICVRGSTAGHKGSSASNLSPESTDFDDPELDDFEGPELNEDEQLDAIAHLASGGHSQTVSQAKTSALEAIRELQAKIRTFTGSDEKLNRVEREIRSITHFLEFGIIDKTAADYGAVEEVSLDDSGAVEEHLDVNLEEQPCAQTHRKIGAHRLDHVYSKKRE